MVCYLPGTGTLAVFGFAVYLVWHKAIAHFLALAGTGAEIALLLGAEAVAAVALVWTARMIRRRRAQAGACTTCRFRCQEALSGRPNLLVNRVDRRATPPVPVRPPVRICHPAAPLLRASRPSARPASASRPTPASASRPTPASRPVSAPRRTVPAGERWPLASRNTLREPAPAPVVPRETVAFDGYVLTPDGVNGRPSTAIEH